MRAVIFFCLAMFIKPSLALGLPKPDKTLYWGIYGDRLISQSGKIDRDLTLLRMKQKAQTNPLLIIGGDSIFIVRYPKLENKPIYLFEQLSAELQNIRLNGLINFSDYGFGQINYQINNDLILDGFITLGNLDKSPFFATIGKQYIPYGDFNKFEAEVNPLNKTIFRIDKPAFTASYYDQSILLRASLVDNNDYNNKAIAISVQGFGQFNDINWHANVGLISDINNMTKPLIALSRHDHAIPAYDLFTIMHARPFAMRIEITQTLRNLASTQKLGAYNIDTQYTTTILKRPTKFSFAISGLYNQGNLQQDPAFQSLGLLAHQFVISAKHRIYPNLTTGISFLIGKQQSYQTQAILNLSLKV